MSHRSDRLSRFSALLAREITPGDAAVKMGLQRTSGAKLLRELRDEMGEQTR